MKAQTTETSSRQRILVVDDEESIRDSLNIFLTDFGYEVMVAQDAETALTLAREADFDVAVVDRILPNCMNGVEVIRDIKKLNPLCETILMSAYPSFESAAKTMEQETVAYLTKPIQQDEICRIVELAAQKSLDKREYEQNELMLQVVFNTSPNAIIVYDGQLRIRFINPAFTKLFGYVREECMGQGLLLVPGADEQLVRQEFRCLREGKAVKEREQGMIGNDGSLLTVSRIISLCESQKSGAADILVIIRDISEEKKLLAQVTQSEKLALLGQLAAKLAHEINNPLQVITGNTELLLRESLEDATKKALSLILSASGSIERLTRNLLEVAKPKPLTISTFPPEQPLENAADFLQNMGLTKYHTIIRDYGCGRVCIQGDFHQLEQVFMNLLVNASHAMADASEQVITLRTCFDQERGQVHLSVSDTGSGIDGAIIEKIFDPFFSTKLGALGNGLGLAVVKQIIDRHDGSVTVSSQPDQGATFTVSLAAKPEQKETVGASLGSYTQKGVCHD